MSVLGGRGDVAPNMKFRAAAAAPLSHSLDYRLIHARPLIREFSLKEGDLMALCVVATGELVLTFESEQHPCSVISSARGSVRVEGNRRTKPRKWAQKHPEKSAALSLIDQVDLLGTGEGYSR